MDKYVDPTFLLSQATLLWHWFYQKALTTDTLVEAGVIAVGLMLAPLLARPLIKWMQRLVETRDWQSRLPGRLIGAAIPLIKYVLPFFCSGSQR